MKTKNILQIIGQVLPLIPLHFAPHYHYLSSKFYRFLPLKYYLKHSNLINLDISMNYDHVIFSLFFLHLVFSNARPLS